MLSSPASESVPNSAFVAMRQLKVNLTNAGVFGSESGGPLLQRAVSGVGHVRVHEPPNRPAFSVPSRCANEN